MSSILSVPLTSGDVPPAAQSSALTSSAPAAGGMSGQGFTLPSMGLTQLARNPQLPQHPLGAYTDSLYEADVAQLRQEILQRYGDVLQQLGYTDEQGNFIPGQVEIDANKQRAQLNRSIQLADEGVTQQHQQQGTLFSGLRGTNTARAQFPFQSALADLDVQVPKALTSLYGQAGGLVNEFNTRQNRLLAEAAARRAAGFTSLSTSDNLAGGAGGASDGSLLSGVVPPSGDWASIEAPGKVFGRNPQLPNGWFDPQDPAPVPSTNPLPRSGLPIAY